MNSPEGLTLVLLLILVPVMLSLVCHPSDYQIGQNCCPKCPAGKRVTGDCNEFRSRSCLPCHDGMYMDEPTGRTLCYLCRTCPSGSGLKVKTPCNSTSNTVCEPQEGYFCVELSDEGICMTAQKHKSCNPGEFILKPGSASADTECWPCAEGTFSNGTLSRCQPHTQCQTLSKVTTKEGTLDSDTECREGSSESVVIGISVGVVLVLLIGASVAALLVYRKMKVKAKKLFQEPFPETFMDVFNLNPGPDKSARADNCQPDHSAPPSVHHHLLTAADESDSAV